MGGKDRAKALMEQAGVPLVPGYHGDDQADRFWPTQAMRIGFPLLIKAVAGGGGKGMRIVAAEADFAAAMAACAARGRVGLRRRPAADRENIWSGRATSRCRCSPTPTATPSTCSSATARSSGATRR